jgi:anti-sigma factor RsiW
MKCDDFQLMISTYIDNALDAPSQGSMFAHLGTCDECRMFLRRMLDLRGRFAAIPAPEVPVSLDKRVMGATIKRARRVKGERIRSLWSHRLSVPLPSAALIALALITATVISISLWQKPDVISLYCLPAVDVYAEQPTNPANSK